MNNNRIVRRTRKIHNINIIHKNYTIDHIVIVDTILFTAILYVSANYRLRISYGTLKYNVSQKNLLMVTYYSNIYAKTVINERLQRVSSSGM